MNNLQETSSTKDETLSINIQVIKGADLTEKDVHDFNAVTKAGYPGRGEILKYGEIPSEDLHFILKVYNNSEEKAVAAGRYRRVTQITIGDQIYPDVVWGRADIATVPEYSGKGYGTDLVKKMVEYGAQRGMSCVGFHGKTATVRKSASVKLSDFYKRAGLEVDENLGAKIIAPDKNGVVRPMDFVNVSYLPGDPFIDTVRNSDRPTYLPYSW